MAAPSELDPSLKPKQQLETVCARWGVTYDDAIQYYGGEIAYLLGGQDPVGENEVLENLNMVPKALQPSPDSAYAIADRKAYMEGVPDAAKALLLPHVEAEGNRIGYLDDDPKQYEAQRPMRFSVDGERQPRENTDFMAEKVDERYPEAMEKLSADEGSKEAIQTAIKLMQQGKSIIGITFHAKDIIDTAIALKFYLDLFDEQGYSPDKTALNLSKSLAWGEYEVPGLGPVVMIDVVKTIADRTHLSWPKTDSSEDMLRMLPQREINRNNKYVATDIKQMLADGNSLVVISPTGSTRGGGVKAGTAELMAHPDSYVMPLSLWRMGEELKVRCMPPVNLKGAADVDILMVSFAKDLSDLVPDQDFLYTPHLRA
ncbi:MAG TPA: hypothetical protein VFX86_02750 [Candidatus Saccharimonadales bacterium]|nr:hypothetical protein [Candidatus Saccharimonadales bacterium]